MDTHKDSIPECNNSRKACYDLMIQMNFHDFSPSERELITDKMHNFYFGNSIDDLKDKDMTDSLSDIFLSVGIFESLKICLQDDNIGNIDNNKFVYMFSHKGFASFYKLYSNGSEEFHGTAHADELLYLFPAHRFYPLLNSSIPSADDRRLSESMVKLWVNFAATG